ncbi:hypothetical protein PV327_011419 [Microctonus hyperodae]|uniref:Uncharacterized protein n=1 Tax=Microctonus hyperodae TaxID=165561 RepID=A0AA39FJ02_MICHY|nr:hypothetical protein PV327_011419 [Microctonus hyperodae]
MALFKISFLILFCSSLMIIVLTNGADGENNRKSKLGFDMFEMIHESFCNDICEIPSPKSRTSRTIILCLIKCGGFSVPTSKPSSTPSSSSTEIPKSTTDPLAVMPISESPGVNEPMKSRRELPSSESGKIHSNKQSSSDSPFDNTIKTYFKENPKQLSALNISIPVSLNGLVFGKLSNVGL